MKKRPLSLKTIVGIAVIILAFCASNSLAKRISRATSGIHSSSTPEVKATPLEAPPERATLTIKKESDLTSSEEATKAYNYALSLLPTKFKNEGISKLLSIISDYPDTVSARLAMHTFGEVKLDQFFDKNTPLAKRSYVVKKGDTFSKIAIENETSIENILALNSLNSHSSVNLGAKLKLMPLYFNLVVDLKNQRLELQYGKKPVKFYPFVEATINPTWDIKATFIEKITALNADTKPVLSTSADYREAKKVIKVNNLDLQISSSLYEIPEGATIISVSPEAIEELALVLRKGNLVEILY